MTRSTWPIKVRGKDEPSSGEVSIQKVAEWGKGGGGGEEYPEEGGEEGNDEDSHRDMLPFANCTRDADDGVQRRRRRIVSQ